MRYCDIIHGLFDKFTLFIYREFVVFHFINNSWFNLEISIRKFNFIGRLENSSCPVNFTRSHRTAEDEGNTVES